MPNKDESDRISWSEGMKLNLGGYQSHDIHMSLSSDLREGETVNDAVTRCQVEVRLHLEARKEEILPAPIPSGKNHPSNEGVDLEAVRQNARKLFTAFQKTHPKLAKELVETLPKEPTCEDYDRMVMEMEKALK